MITYYLLQHDKPQFTLAPKSEFFQIKNQFDLIRLLPDCPTPFFTVVSSNDVWYKNKFTDSLLIFNKFPYCNAVYSDFDVYDIGTNKTSKSMTFSYNPRLINMNIMINPIFRTGSLTQISHNPNWEQETFSQFMKTNFCYHIPQPLFLRRIQSCSPYQMKPLLRPIK